MHVERNILQDFCVMGAFTDEEGRVRERREGGAGGEGDGGPAASHRAPATTLASRIATPETRLKNLNPVPRRSAGAASATSAAKTPCVKPMCGPQKNPALRDDISHLRILRAGHFSGATVNPPCAMEKLRASPKEEQG